MKQNIENLIALLDAQQDNSDRIAKIFEEKGNQETAKRYKREAFTLRDVLALLRDKKHFSAIADIYLTSKETLKTFVIENNARLEYFSNGDDMWSCRSDAVRYDNFEEANAMRHRIAKTYHIPLKFLEVRRVY